MENKKLFFICGTGRSGTHLVGRCISSHPQVVGRIEERETFSLITKIATTQDFIPIDEKEKLNDELIQILKKILKNSDSHILEKSHPSLWLMEFLMEKLPDSKFICVYRDLEPTVSSMLEHVGILEWYKNLPQNIPNRFLGITNGNKDYFENLKIEEKCALRWKSHYDEIFRLQHLFPEQMHLVKYDNFLTSPDKYLLEISKFLKISNDFSPEVFKIDSLDKWKDLLTVRQIEKMNSIIQN